MTMGYFDTAQMADLVIIIIIIIIYIYIYIYITYIRRKSYIYRKLDYIEIINLFSYLIVTVRPKTSKLQKKIITEFRSLGLKIEISSKLKVVNFLDATFDLDNNTFKLFN